jgi:hypothetical protein
MREGGAGLSPPFFKFINMAIQRFLFFAALLSLSLSGYPKGESTTYWQLVLRYSEAGVKVVSAAPMPPLAKAVRSPGHGGAAGYLKYQLDWLDEAGLAVASTQAELPLGNRLARPTAQDTADWSKQATHPRRPRLIPLTGVVVVRVPGPAAGNTARSIRLTRGGGRRAARDTSNLPVVLRATQLELPLPQSLAIRDGLISSEKIQDTGPDSNRPVFVILGDGFTSATLANTTRYTDAITSFTEHFQATSPWSELHAAINMYRGDVESNEDGADDKVMFEDPLTEVDTYFDASFWIANISRFLYLSDDGVERAIAVADEIAGVGVWDEIIVLVNADKRGGGGGIAAVVSLHDDAPDTILHELGHTFADLADEYSAPFPGFPPGDWEANVDFDYAYDDLKWNVWVEPDTPLPTLEIWPDDQKIGAFEGARYLNEGIYRPRADCKMRYGGRYCEICEEALILAFHDMTSLADSTSHTTETTVIVSEPGVAFGVEPLPLEGLTYAWTLDGEQLTEGDAATSVTLTWSDIATTASLELMIRHETDRVRLRPIEEVWQWTVERSGVRTLWLTK